jgi:hypothetical protein
MRPAGSVLPAPRRLGPVTRDLTVSPKLRATSDMPVQARKLAPSRLIDLVADRMSTPWDSAEWSSGFSEDGRIPLDDWHTSRPRPSATIPGLLR